MTRSPPRRITWSSVTAIERSRSVTAEEWVGQFAGEIGADAPSRDEFDEVLKLAAEAAHASERTAAPVACWIAGKTGRPLAELIEAAEGVGDATS
jgi:hypothetical protein